MTRDFVRFGLVPGFVIRLGMIVYSVYHDERSTLKYTDIDYQVFSDAARAILSPNQASWIGSPYDRATYRYTPLLALILTPNQFIHPCWGKGLFAIADLGIGFLLYRLCPAQTSRSHHARLVTLIWVLNPFVINISTRGSSEAVLGVVIIGFLYSAERAHWDLAAGLLGLAVHLKIFPFIYGTAVWARLRTGSGNNHNLWSSWLSINRQQFRFGALSLLCFLSLNVIMYAIWGHQFIESSFLYHLHRLDHRHNFSPYFYPIYLRFTASESDLNDPSILNHLLKLVQHPLINFVPQISLCLMLCLYYGRRDLTFGCFIGTYCFVIFNKVSTSQYFMWYLWFIPLLISKIKLGRLEALGACSVWVGTQLIWLSNAYQLEFIGQPVFLRLWLASILFFIGHSLIVGMLIIGFSRSSIKHYAQKDK